jgi:hypothetical protein
MDDLWSRVCHQGTTYSASPAFQVDRLWSRVLDHLSDGELLALCPACRKDLYVVVGQFVFFVAEGNGFGILRHQGRRSDRWKL